MNLTKRVLVKGRWRYCPVVIASNGRIRQDCVLVGNKEQLHAEGEYHLDWRHRGKRKRLAVGKDATNALNVARGKKASPAVVSEPFEPGADSTLPAAIARYLAEIKTTKKPKTLAAYALSLEYFA